VPQVHAFATEHNYYLLVVNGSRIYQVSEDMSEALQRAVTLKDRASVDRLLTQYGLDAPAYVTDEAPTSFPTSSLSLAIAQKCNLGCTYCYAQGGDFGGPAKNMPLQTAIAAVDRLIGEAAPGERVNLAFLGGEPLVNRPVLYAATEYATQQAALKDVRVTFSITTNGTLVTPDDGKFFERHGFAVTVSLDGVGEVHDQLRSFKNGHGSYQQIIQRVTPLLDMQRRMQVSARVTVTPRNLGLREILTQLVQMGFHSVGFSPMLSSPTGRDEMAAPSLEAMLAEMVACGREFERQVVTGRRYPFLNMVNAMQELHKGTHRPYPCGAGAGYFGVSADGGLFACHRFVDNAAGAMGHIARGVDRERQAKWLAERHVHFQEPCRSCWARYLCGGGCHHEVIQRGRVACDYIRGWLHYCLQAYVRLLARSPDYFGVSSSSTIAQDCGALERSRAVVSNAGVS
jgi:uncharacterized protein